ncbi:hypothetical protein EDD27_1601 [Nonomuraea polychroma]|uniref:Uncharacterized protein n=1 Tax=Nonomuraea polychroma TaxID=46176 RepID=A0A438M162_9ACTN|nr:hypothetical protein [Nonomuraea polychroma]RVX39253.1 hypothetical protein EDD27_1601 [Nonomuraea polychroma]
MLVGIVVWIVGAQDWNFVLALGGPVILLVVLGAVCVSITRMSDVEWSPAGQEQALPAAGARPGA